MAENTEEFLLKISKYQIIASQLNGYFPLSISQTANSKNGRLVSRLTFSVLRIPLIYTLVQCIIFPLILRQLSNFNSFIVTSVTNRIVSDGVTLRVLTAMYICNPIIHRVFGLFLSKRALNLWKKNCSLLEFFYMDRFSRSALLKNETSFKSRLLRNANSQLNWNNCVYSSWCFIKSIRARQGK